MTALTMPARPEEDTSLRPVPWRRMAWVTWRQHRIALGGVAVLLSALAVYLWLTGLQLHHAYAAVTASSHTTRRRCRGRTGPGYGPAARRPSGLKMPPPSRARCR
jgi:hypothetical protein